MTKVAGPGGMKWLRGGPVCLNGKNITTALEGSLRCLRTNYVDVLLLHWFHRCHHCPEMAVFLLQVVTSVQNEPYLITLESVGMLNHLTVVHNAT